MKYSKMKKRLADIQRWWDNQKSDSQKATTRPGSVKWR